MKYTISYSNPQNQAIKITAEFEIEKSKLTTLLFPTWRPGRYELGHFAKNITQFKVFDENNTRLNIQKTKTNTWLVDTNNADKLTVTYLYYAADLNAGSTFMNDEQLYVNPVNCLVYVDNQQNKPCELSVIIPSDFIIASGLPFNNNTVKTKDYHELVDTPFICSPTLKQYEYKIKDLTFYLWIQGHHQLNWKKVKSDFMKFTTAQLIAFGKFPVKNYHFIYQITPYKSYHGVEHAHSTVIALGPTYQIMNVLYDDFLGISSHELYHTWNIKSIRPKEMLPYDYSQENYSKLGYVAEGVTTYMGDLFLSKSKVKTWDWYKKELEQLIQKHIDNFGRFNHSVAESSTDTWLDGYTKGVPNRKVSIYNEGALLAFVTDISIRHETENTKSLHDVMQSLYLNFGDKNIGYTDEDYINLICEYLGKEGKELFENYFYKANSYENIITEALFNCGLELNTDLNPNYTQRLLGIKTTLKNEQLTITDVVPGSTVELAGLIIGDQIISINHFLVNNDLHQWLTYFEHDQITLGVSRQNRQIELICPITNRTYYPVCKINKVKIPSGLQKRIFKNWCGYKWIEE